MTPRTARILLIALLALELLLILLGPQAKEHLGNIQAATAAGKRPEWWDDAAMGVRYAAWLNAGLLGVMLLTVKLWSRPLAGPETGTTVTNRRTSRWFWPALTVAVMVCLGLRLPLASKSLWWDEAWVIMQASHGKWTPDKKHDGQMKFLAHDWKRCAWYYQKPTNHAPMSLLQKASITAWQKINHAKLGEFSDLAARVPALVASCVAVVLLGLLLRAWGMPGAGVCAAFVLAIHPWHVRYGVDARAYALVVPLCISGMFAVTRIVEWRGRGSWPWLWWGVTEVLWMWAFPNAGIFNVAALNILVAGMLWIAHADTGRRRTVMLRLAATNVFAAMGFIQMFLPNLMQACRWAGVESDAHLLTWSMAGDSISQLCFGIFEPGAYAHTAVGAGLIAVAGLGAYFILRRREFRSGGTTLVALSVSSGVFALVTLVMGSYFYPRFVVALLPVLIATLCCSLARLRIPLVSVACVAWFMALAFPTLKNELTEPISPLHGAATFVDQQGASNPVIACYGLGREVMPVYSRSCIPLEKREDVEAVIQRARSGNKVLYVICGYDSFNRSMLPSGFPLLDDHGVFEEVRRLPALEPEFSFRVLRMK